MIINLIATVVIAYLLGNISPSIIISKKKGNDIRNLGSKNAGTTNMLRNYGKKAAIITLVVDVLKGILAVWIGKLFAAEIGGCLCALAVVCGHIWPVFYKFKGGKGVAASLGAILGISLPLGFCAFLIALAVVLFSKMMSVGSICAALSLPFLSLKLYPNFTPFSFILTILIVVKHKENIKRVLKGQESRISFKK